MDRTLRWYRENLEAFVARTADVDMTEHYRKFLKYVAPGGRILDLGCGAGSATAYFLRGGYAVEPVDGCRELCDYAARRTGCQARQLLFQNLDYTEEFDGVWACASLLHVPKADMPEIFTRIARAMKPGGVFYASYKYGSGEHSRNGRLFSDYTEQTMKAALAPIAAFTLLELWSTEDARPDRAGEHWINFIVRKE